ncbi:glycosyltransferase [Alkalihalophilus sp. As8PL]|uniref:Glycosyltransferase n=1 Tax=Alkalihalophilus sp. As8PL TaxID=3237103 RepID=A0AB39BWG4_9BACI
MDNLFSSIMWFFGWTITIYMLIVIGFYTFLLGLSLFQIRKEHRLDKQESHDDYLQDDFVKPVSILVPAFNEEAGVIESVRSLVSLKYPETEIIVVNDGSTDQTLSVIIEEFHMEKIDKVIRKQLECEEIRGVYQSAILPHLLLVDKVNGGKADALNAGINVSKYPYFCSIDGDSILENDSLLKVMKPIIHSDGEVIASGGSIRIANGCEIELGSVLKVGLSRNPLVVMQVIEYLRAFLMGRVGLSRHNMLLIISGAFSVFSKKWAIEAGGYSKHTVGEDMELVVRIHGLIRKRKLKKRIEFVADPVCWTEAPDTLKTLQRQRSRWHRGLLESLWTHKNMTLNPRYGLVGTVAFPYFWFVELIGPIVELGGYLFVLLSFFLGEMYVEMAILLLLLMVVYGSLFSMMSVLLEVWSMNQYPRVRDVMKLYFYSMLESFWYRPLTVIWRCEGILQWLVKYRGWDKNERKGISKL